MRLLVSRLVHSSVVAGALLFGAPTAFAAGDAAPAAVAADAITEVNTTYIEASVEVDATGALASLAIATEMDPKLRANLEQRVRGWRFRPVTVDGVAQPARAQMRVHLVARKDGDGFLVNVERATFGDVTLADGVVVPTARSLPLPKDATPPRYPASILRWAELSASVLLGIRVAPDGSVAEVVPVQTRLFDLKARPRELNQFIREFERTAVKSARTWRFTLPADAATLSAADLTVMMPIRYGVRSMPRDLAGVWVHEARTARATLPWLPADPKANRVAVVGADGDESFAVGPLALETEVEGTAL
jgi:hypothetical protein